MSDEPMRNNQDPFLARLFAEQDRSLRADDFMAAFLMRLEQEQRRQRVYSTLAIVAILTVAAFVAPWIAQATPIFINLVAECSGAWGSFLQSPLTWLVGGALAFAFLPVIYVWRTFRN
jgi:sterol desaturase/sphingolipid hydroxylase (fatty acid hydroxylase superfamily)